MVTLPLEGAALVKLLMQRESLPLPQLWAAAALSFAPILMLV